MSKALRLFALAIIGCLLQTNVSQFLQIADVAPDMMTALLVALTSFADISGCFCTAALMIMFYDASVGYVMALNPVVYVLISLAASYVCGHLRNALKKWKHKSYLIILLVCFVLTLARELVYVGYLYLIGAELGLVTFLRMTLCAGYTALMSIPCIYLIRFVMNWHPLKLKKWEQPTDDETGAFDRVN